MSKLYTLLYGKSKSRMKPIMVSTHDKCINYRNARGIRLNGGWHDIVPAENNAVVWRQKSSTIGGNKPDGCSGYVSKHGFQHHT